MTNASRKDLRAQLVADLQALTSITEVIPYLPRKLSGKSPVCSVESGGWQPVNTEEPTMVRVIIGFWVRRSPEPDQLHPDPEDAENVIDDLALQLAQLMEAEYNASAWRPSSPDYEVIDGVSYRIEFHYYEVQWW